MVRKEFLLSSVLIALMSFAVYQRWWPVNILDQWRTKHKTQKEYKVDTGNYAVYDKSEGQEPFITVDFLKGKHFWHPQLVIWLEDSTGRYLQTLVVTTSTAKGLFYSGRSADNFKTFDDVKQVEDGESERRVDALPYWSHKRGVKYHDGLYAPTSAQPLPDAISGATPQDNFYFTASSTGIDDLEAFKVLVEVNVAFDENEYFSEYDFVDDSVYHSGTGLLGQPSVIYACTIRKSDETNYYVLDLIGHGHHSGADGRLYSDVTTLTTAKDITERIIVGINERWYDH